MQKKGRIPGTEGPGTDALGNSQPIQTANWDTIKEERSGEKAKDVAGHILLVPGKNQKVGVFS